MGWNGSGVFNRITGIFTGATVWADTLGADRDVRADDHDTHDEDIATGLENTVTRDGQNSASANLPMGGFRHTGVDDAVARDDYAATGQVQDQAFSFITAANVAGTADAITLSPTPAITAYAAGQQFVFVAEAANTGAVTVDVSSLGTKSITKDGTTALIAGDIQNTAIVVIVYDGTQFQVDVAAASPVTTRGDVIIADSSGLESRLAVGTVGQIFTSDGTDPAWSAKVTLDTPLATTSGTTKDFTIPSGISLIFISFIGVSSSVLADLAIELGDAGGIETTGYASTVVNPGSGSGASSTTDLILTNSGASGDLWSGVITLAIQDSSANQWASSGNLDDGAELRVTAGEKALSAELTTVRLTISAGAFDAGSINVSYL